MPELNYTKGEWYLEKDTGLILSIPEGQDKPIEIANIGGGDYMLTPKPLKELEANAYLISASPIGRELAQAVLNNEGSVKIKEIAHRFMAKANSKQ